MLFRVFPSSFFLEYVKMSLKLKLGRYFKGHEISVSFPFLCRALYILFFGVFTIYIYMH